ncbi:right-handed parallel beta-helix repeat-containing protein [Pedobacter cryoconitis]|uniref:right-handed parallel beta-helix repeat-containing protein n=1 Tax=Pedobacter cryoconitis TaxID=188932 RepID=UPI00161DF127|nr:glycosyl hydrolase family 28-related protein [Pedobacter cryoconitis]MBB5647473.1 hypothetical protein [Pedobacter cryoconitis]
MSYSKLKLIVAFVLINVSCSFSQQPPVKIYNVKDFGAKGNGIADDYSAIQKCINEALKDQNSRVVFPAGKYKISKGLIAHYLNNNFEMTGEIKNNEYPVISCTALMSVLSIRGYLETQATGTVSISNLNLQGGFGAYHYSASNQFINTNNWFCGLSVTDKKSAKIKNVKVSDIYGQGIYISATKQVGIPLTSRFNDVSILNCKVINCWGYNPKADDYGDGIYIADVSSAVIKNNLVKNDFSITKQLGRCGIVLEFMAEKCTISNNNIFGYDRGIHLEADYGGHLISQNTIWGTDMGIVLFNNNEIRNYPVKIIDNIVSNNGLPKSTTLKRTRDINAISDRSLMNFVAGDNSRAGSLIEGNTFTVSGDFDYFSNSIVNIKADNLIIRKNKYVVKQPQKLKYPILFNNYSNSIPVNDSFQGIGHLQLKKSYSGNKGKIINTNKMNSTPVEFNL